MDGGNTMTGDPADDWLIVVPVKGGTDAKSRIVAPVCVDRHTLAVLDRRRRTGGATG
jgi:hypothetical protein